SGTAGRPRPVADQPRQPAPATRRAEPFSVSAARGVQDPRKMRRRRPAPVKPLSASFLSFFGRFAGRVVSRPVPVVRRKPREIAGADLTGPIHVLSLSRERTAPASNGRRNRPTVKRLRLSPHHPRQRLTRCEAGAQ